MKINDLKNQFRNISSDPESEMREFVISIAKELNLDAGHVISDRILMLRAANLNPKQRDALDAAINSLISDGIFENKNGSLALTEKGKEIIY